MGRYDKITDAYYQGLMASVGYRQTPDRHREFLE